MLEKDSEEDNHVQDSYVEEELLSSDECARKKERGRCEDN